MTKTPKHISKKEQFRSTLAIIVLAIGALYGTLSLFDRGLAESAIAVISVCLLVDAALNPIFKK